jgi:hypothetical protein
MLGIAVEKVCEIIARARAFDAQIPLGESEEEPGNLKADDDIDEEDIVERAENYSEDPDYQDLVQIIDALNVEEQINLVALVWIGRGDFTADEIDAALEAANDAHNTRTGEYLLGMPLFGDYLEEALSQFGLGCEE